MENSILNERKEVRRVQSRYIDEYLPTEYQYCLDSLNMIVKEMRSLQT
jgi:hypothetical protein